MKILTLFVGLTIFICHLDAQDDLDYSKQFELGSYLDLSVNSQIKVNSDSDPKHAKGMEAAPPVYVVGNKDIYTVECIDITLPNALKDRDGGTIRLIMQHELNAHDQIRIIDEHIALEHHNDNFGNRGRHNGLYGWTRQSGGGDHAWVLGDNIRHTIAKPWGWAWIVDYKWGEAGTGVFPNTETIRVCSHQHVTTRVIIKD
jgi:hypothetical protein